MVEKGTPGFETRLITGKIAKRASWQADVTMRDVRVPSENRLPGATTFDDAAAVLAKARPGIAWGALGHAVAAYEAAVAYCLEREQFGTPDRRLPAHPVPAGQDARRRHGDAADLHAPRRLWWTRTASPPAMASLAKMHNAEKALSVVHQARDLLGGNGILLENHVARHLGDAEVVSTVEGTDVVHALIVGRAITGLSAFS